MRNMKLLAIRKKRGHTSEPYYKILRQITQAVLILLLRENDNLWFLLISFLIHDRNYRDLLPLI